MALDQGHAQPPPADLAGRLIPIDTVSGVWCRIGKAAFSPLYYTDSDGWRFSAPTMPGTLYLGIDPPTCFWEVFWDDLAARSPGDRRLDDAKVTERSLWEITLPRPMRVIDTTKPETLRALSAHGGTFLGPYSICQQWAAALRVHGCAADGLIYESARNKGQACLALFAERTKTDAWVVPGAGVELKNASALAPLLAAHRLTSVRTTF